MVPWAWHAVGMYGKNRANVGEVVDGTASIDELGERIFRLMLETASGRKTKSELHGYGQSEFVPWQLGALM